MSDLPTQTAAANVTDFVSWRHCEVHTRSTFSILSLCLSTLVICVWNAVHPDVPFPRKPRWRVYLSRLYGFLVGLFLPEVLVLNALNEFLAARQLLQTINGTQSESPFAISYWKMLLKEMYPRVLTIPYWTEAWRPKVLSEKLQWSMIHAFHATAGGFLAKSRSGHLTRLILLRDIQVLCESDNMRPLFLAESIDDRSKAGALAKALFCWQLLVFAISCVARRADHLPLSLLEITTLAHSLCGLAAFALWWHKPHSVDEALVVPVGRVLEAEITWNQPNGPSDDEAIAGIMILTVEDSVARAVLSSLAVAVLYGLPHLIALGTEFPTLAERRCWQVATAILIGEPLFFVVIVGLFRSVPSTPRTMMRITLLGLLPSVYCVASCFIIGESFRQLFALPSGAFLAPALVCYLPHFS